MSDPVRLALAFLLACGATLLLTPLAIALARRTNFYDHPAGYKGHLRATPYLGGIAVVGGTLLSGIFFSHAWDDFLPVAIGAFALLILGTIDDRYALGPLLRLAIEATAAIFLFDAGIGWSIFSADALNLALTVVFVAGVVNAFNLMDNMDGATGTVAGVSGVALGVLAAAEGNPELGALAFALAGACLGFLRYNLASPARIFLGDGGSMPVGFLVAATIMAIPHAGHLSWALVPVAVVLVGLPALDTTLVVISRRRRGAGVFTGGRDHLTHRLRSRLGTPRRVALVLAASQAFACGLGAIFFSLDEPVAALASVALIAFGIVAVAWLESPGWAPAPVTSESSA